MQINKHLLYWLSYITAKFQQIADALKVTIRDFFDDAPSNGIRLTGEEDQLLQAFRKVKNAEMRECVLKLVGNLNKRAK